MCGHGIIGLATMLTDFGMVPWQGDTASVAVDTPAGRIVTKVTRTPDGGSRVKLVNVPSFHYLDTEVEVSGSDLVPIQIAFGGLFFAMINATALGIPLVKENLTRLMDIGQEVKNKLNQRMEFKHPSASTAVAETLRQFEFYETISSSPPAWKHLVLYGPGDTFTVDRSPCGTGTSAKMAIMFANGDLKLGQDIHSESFVGTVFTGRIVGLAKVGEYQAVIPEIEGSAYLTASVDFFIDPNDPLKHGFQLGL
jgi:proline racemase